MRKTAVLVHLSYARTFSNNLWAANIRIRTNTHVAIALDLNMNLHTRNKTTNSYVDARELADGEIGALERVQIADDMVLQGIALKLKHLDSTPEVWRLTVELEGPHSFLVRPEVAGPNQFQALLLHVVPTP